MSAGGWKPLLSCKMSRWNRHLAALGSGSFKQNWTWWTLEFLGKDYTWGPVFSKNLWLMVPRRWPGSTPKGPGRSSTTWVSVVGNLFWFTGKMPGVMPLHVIIYSISGFFEQVVCILNHAFGKMFALNGLPAAITTMPDCLAPKRATTQSGSSTLPRWRPG